MVTKLPLTKTSQRHLSLRSLTTLTTRVLVTGKMAKEKRKVLINKTFHRMGLARRLSRRKALNLPSLLQTRVCIHPKNGKVSNRKATKNVPKATLLTMKTCIG